MEKNSMSPEPLGIFAARAGLLGAAMIGLSFAVNPGPPPGTMGEQLAAFGQLHHSSILWGAWLQAVGPALIIFFALALVHLAGAQGQLAGWMTLFGAGVLMMVSLTEVVFYISALSGDPGTIALISTDIAHAVQHLYFIVAAPALFLPLGMVLRASSVLPRAFGDLAIVLGVAFFILGIASLQTLVLSSAVTSLAAIQAFWWVAAAYTLLLRSRKMPH